MREIKFRAWFITLKTMHYNFDVEEYLGGFVKKHNENDNVVLMQYTGLKDKNDKEIYEGDVVKIINIKRFEKENLKGKTGVVVWQELWCRYQVDLYWSKNKKSCGIELFKLIGYTLIPGDTDEISFNEILVIGNIYENLELKGEI